MRRKYKITGCARFFIFLLIFTPVVLVGVSYYNGNNPLEQVKELLSIESSERPVEKSVPVNNTSSVSNEGILKSTIETQKTTIEELRKEVRDLEKAVKDRDREIDFLKQSGNE